MKMIIDNELKSRVEMMARDCDPAVVVRLEVFENILIVNVQEGKDKPPPYLFTPIMKAPSCLSTAKAGACRESARIAPRNTATA